MIEILEKIVKEHGWNSIADCLDNSMYQRRIEFIEQACKEYARIMCDKQKKICSIKAETKDDSHPHSYTSYYVIDESSILNAPYPDELQGDN